MEAWAEILTVALDMERRAETIRTAALARRCGAEDSGGGRCTRDLDHRGGHRHLASDLPAPR